MKGGDSTNFHYLAYTFIFKGWENVLFELGSASRVKLPIKSESGVDLGEGGIICIIMKIHAWDVFFDALLISSP